MHEVRIDASEGCVGLGVLAPGVCLCISSLVHPVSVSHESTTGIAFPAASVGGDGCRHGGNLRGWPPEEPVLTRHRGVARLCLKAGPGSLGDV